MVTKIEYALGGDDVIEGSATLEIMENSTMDGNRNQIFVVQSCKFQKN